MARRPLNLLTALSLLLCVAVCVLWVRSYFVRDAVWWTRADDVGGNRYSWFRMVASGSGRLAWSCDAEVYQRSSITAREAARQVGRWQREAWQQGPVRYQPPQTAFGGRPNLHWGFHFAWRSDGATVLREIALPYWAVVLPAALLPTWWVARKRRSPPRPGACPICGYDLRATPDRCPECGSEASVTPTA